MVELSQNTQNFIYTLITEHLRIVLTCFHNYRIVFFCLVKSDASTVETSLQRMSMAKLLQMNTIRAA
jgi:hypothetical protein